MRERETNVINAQYTTYFIFDLLKYLNCFITQNTCFPICFSVSYWGKTEPNNGEGKYGEEDCAHTTEVDWNDLSCGRRLRRICEASALDA